MLAVSHRAHTCIVQSSRLRVFMCAWPIQFELDSNHLAKWIRIQSGSVQCSSVWTHRMHIRCPVWIGHVTVRTLLACPWIIEMHLYYVIYGMPSTHLARAYENVFWLDDRGDKGPCRSVGAKLMSRASSMESRGTAPSTQEPFSLETLSALCILRNRRKSHCNTSSTATRRRTIDGRDTSLLSMVELPFFTRRTARA